MALKRAHEVGKKWLVGDTGGVGGEGLGVGLIKICYIHEISQTNFKWIACHVNPFARAL